MFISDNCSVDDTQDICLAYAVKDRRVRYFRHDYNAGALSNFQFVFDNSQSLYFMWAASDDCRDENWIELILAEVSAREGVACFGRLRHIDENGVEIGHPANDAVLQYSGCRLWRKFKFYLSPEALGKANLFYSIFPRQALSSIELTDFSYDYAILHSILGEVDFLQSNGPVLYKRIHDGSEGDMVREILVESKWLAPFRLLKREYFVLFGYLRNSSFFTRVVLVSAAPVKFVWTLYHYAVVFFKKQRFF